MALEFLASSLLDLEFLATSLRPLEFLATSFELFRSARAPRAFLTFFFSDFFAAARLVEEKADIGVRRAAEINNKSAKRESLKGANKWIIEQVLASLKIFEV